MVSLVGFSPVWQPDMVILNSSSKSAPLYGYWQNALTHYNNNVTLTPKPQLYMHRIAAHPQFAKCRFCEAVRMLNC